MAFLSLSRIWDVNLSNLTAVLKAKGLQKTPAEVVIIRRRKFLFHPERA